MFELYIKRNDEYHRLITDNDISIIFEANQPLNFNFGKSFKTYTIKLSNIADNNILLDNIFNKNRQHTLIFNDAYLMKNDIYIEGILKINKLNNNYVEAQFISGAGIFWESFKNQSLKDFDWSEYNHEKTIANVTDNNLFDGDIKYDFIYRGRVINSLSSQTITNDIMKEVDVAERQPAIRVKAIIDKIFEDYTVNQNFLDSADYNNLYLLGTNQEIEVSDKDFLKNATVYANTTENKNLIDNLIDESGVNRYYFHDYLENIEGNLTLHNNESYRYTCTENASYKISGLIKGTMFYNSNTSASWRSRKYEVAVKRIRGINTTNLYKHTYNKQDITASQIEDDIYFDFESEIVWCEKDDIIEIEIIYENREYDGTGNPVPAPQTQSVNGSFISDAKISITPFLYKLYNEEIKGEDIIPNISINDLISSLLKVFNVEFYFSKNQNIIELQNRSLNNNIDTYDLTPYVIANSETVELNSNISKYVFKYKKDDKDFYSKTEIEVFNRDDGSKIINNTVTTNSTITVESNSSFNMMRVEEPKIIQMTNENEVYTTNFNFRFAFYEGMIDWDYNLHSSETEIISGNTLPIVTGQTQIPKFSNTLNDVTLSFADVTGLYNKYYSDSIIRNDLGYVVKLDIVYDGKFISDINSLSGMDLSKKYYLNINGIKGYYQLIRFETKDDNIATLTLFTDDVINIDNEQIYNYNTSRFVEIDLDDILENLNPVNREWGYYELKSNTSDLFENFIAGVNVGSFSFNSDFDDIRMAELNGSSQYLEIFSSRGFLGSTDGNNHNTVCVWFGFETLPTTDKYIWIASDSGQTIYTGLRFNSATNKIEYVRYGGIYDNVIESNITIQTGVTYSTCCRYNCVSGVQELYINNQLQGSLTEVSPLHIVSWADITPVRLGYSSEGYTKMFAGRFRVAGIYLTDSEINRLQTIIKPIINFYDINNETTTTIPSEWIIGIRNNKVNFTIPPDFQLGEYKMWTELSVYKTDKLRINIVDIPFVDEARDITFDNVNSFTDYFIPMNRAWGGDNGGVVASNVYIGQDDNDDTVLVCEAHGDNYSGNTQGVDRFGNPKFKEDGTPWVTRVGGVAVSKDYFGFGRYEVESKAIQKLGVASAFWTFHYQEIYPNDPRWDEYTKDVIDTGTTQTNLRAQYLFDNNANSSAGADTTENFVITNPGTTSYSTGVKGGSSIRTQLTAGYPFDALNVQTLGSFSNDYTVSFWVKVNLRAANNKRHILISNGSSNNGAWGIQVFYGVKPEYQMVAKAAGNINVDINNPNNKDYGNWQHLVMINDSNSGKCYLYCDGEKIQEINAPLGTYTDAGWWRLANSLSLSGGAAGNVARDIEFSDLRFIARAVDSNEVRAMYGRPNVIGNIDFAGLGLRPAGNEEDGYYLVRNNEIDIEIPSHILPSGDIENPSLENGKFNTWRGEWQNWDVPTSATTYWEEYRNNYRALGIDITDNNYHKYRWDWYHDRVEFYIDDVHIVTNFNYQYGYDSYNIPDVAGKMTIGNWFPSGGKYWAGLNADFEIEKMYVKSFKYTPFTNEINNHQVIVGETYPDDIDNAVFT